MRRRALLKDIFETIQEKADFINFLNELGHDYTINSNEWSNKTVSDFIEQIAS